MSFDIFERFATDENLEVEGVWHDLDSKGKSRIKLARMDNPNYQRVFQQKIEENTEALKAEPESKRNSPESLTRRLLAETIAETVLVDWENLAYKGKVLKYSKENAEMVLSHRDFLDLVIRLAGDITHYKLKLEEIQTKNS